MKFFLQGNVWSDPEKAYLSAHLSVGVGFYHHLILRLQLEYDLKLNGVIDFAYPQNNRCTLVSIQFSSFKSQKFRLTNASY